MKDIVYTIESIVDFETVYLKEEGNKLEFNLYDLRPARLPINLNGISDDDLSLIDEIINNKAELGLQTIYLDVSTHKSRLLLFLNENPFVSFTVHLGVGMTYQKVKEDIYDISGKAW